MKLYDELSTINKEKAGAILSGCEEANPEPAAHIVAMACALALLTSQVKSEREQGKQLVRDWRHKLENPA